MMSLGSNNCISKSKLMSCRGRKLLTLILCYRNLRETSESVEDIKYKVKRQTSNEAAELDESSEEFGETLPLVRSRQAMLYSLNLMPSLHN